MVVSINKALSVENPLAKTPSTPPLFSIPFQSKKNLTIELADPKMLRAILACMNMNAVLGGAACHYGGPAAFAEIISSIHAYAFKQAKEKNKEFYDLYHIINDAGHCENAIYALKAMYGYADLNFNSLKNFRSIRSKLTGHGESHLFPEGVYLSNGPLGSSLAQAQGLAVADALSGIQRTTVVTISDGACMEGEAKEAFSSIPGMAKKGMLAPFVCVISDNNTKLSGRIDEDAFDMAPFFESLDQQGWKRIYVEDGNHLETVANAFIEACILAEENPRQAVCLHLKTLKGIGTKATSESASGGHGFPLKKKEELRSFVNEILNNEKIPAEIENWIQEIESFEKPSKSTSSNLIKEKIQVGVSKALINKYKEGLPIISVSSDLAGSTGVQGFQKEFPEAKIDIGVAESNMISMAAGLSKAGYIPVVDTFAQFAVTKGALPTTMASLSQAPFIGIFSHTGFQDAADGASHQALSYISMVASIPNVNVYTLSCSYEAEALISQAVQNFADQRNQNKVPKTSIFFLGRENFPQYYKEKVSYRLGKAQVLYDTSNLFDKNICLIAAGSTVPATLKAAENLKLDNIGCSVIHASSINQPDMECIDIYIQKSKGKVIIVEDHQAIGGFASILLQALAETQTRANAKVLAVRSKFGQSAYTADELYKKYGMDEQSIYQAAKEL